MADKNKDTADEELHPVSDEMVAEFLRERQERIAARRARIGEKIARKNENIRGEGSVTSAAEFLSDARSGIGSGLGKEKGEADGQARGKREKDGEETSRKIAGGDSLNIQVEESRKLLEQIILDGESLITNVRVAAECREKRRHIKEQESRKERLRRLQEEAAECDRIYEELKPKFNLSAQKKLPMELFDGVKTQMQACEELLMKKQDLIQSLHQELEESDFDFERSLELYQKDVSLMGDRIDDCVDELQQAFLNELTLMEDYTCRNREVQLESHQSEWMDLLKDFEQMEEQNLEQRKTDAMNKFQSLNELYVTTKQECRANRHKCDDDLRILVQELEQIKYATQLNMEKLQYNLAIVRKRYKENVEMKNMMKRLLLKFNDRFTAKSKALKAKMEAGKKEAKKLLMEIHRLEECLDQFGPKILHFAASDWNKYMDLWAVSEELVRDRVQRLLDSEKYIFETQLGIDAQVPELTFMDDRPPAVTKHIMKKNKQYAELTKPEGNDEEEEEEGEGDEGAEGEVGEGEEGEGEEGEDEEGEGEEGEGEEEDGEEEEGGEGQEVEGEGEVVENKETEEAEGEEEVVEGEDMEGEEGNPSEEGEPGAEGVESQTEGELQTQEIQAEAEEMQAEGGASPVVSKTSSAAQTEGEEPQIDVEETQAEVEDSKVEVEDSKVEVEESQDVSKTESISKVESKEGEEPRAEVEETSAASSVPGVDKEQEPEEGEQQAGGEEPETSASSPVPGGDEQGEAEDVEPQAGDQMLEASASGSAVPEADEAEAEEEEGLQAEDEGEEPETDAASRASLVDEGDEGEEDEGGEVDGEEEEGQEEDEEDGEEEAEASASIPLPSPEDQNETGETETRKESKTPAFSYPHQLQVQEYWERPIRMLSAKSDDLWEGMLYSFQEFNSALIKRNAMVDEAVELYRKNYELSFLLKNHMADARQRSPRNPNARPLDLNFNNRFC